MDLSESPRSPQSHPCIDRGQLRASLRVSIAEDGRVFSEFLDTHSTDCILLGVVLAIIRDNSIYRRFEPFAKYVALAGLVATAWGTQIWGIALLERSPVPEAFLIPIWNLTALGIVVAVMREGSMLNSMCSGSGIRWLGARSYALYLFHFTYRSWFMFSVAPRLAQFMPHRLAILVAIAAAFALTVFLASLSYRIIEQPAMNIREAPAIRLS